MNKYWAYILLISVFPLILSAQSDYILTDSAKSVGIKLLDGGELLNSKICKEKRIREVISYSPYEIKEYGFKNGRVYISKEVQLSDSTVRIFLERLVQGKITLYYYRGTGFKTYFIERDSTLFVQLPKYDEETGLSFVNQLHEITFDCSAVKEATELVSYNNNSLRRLVTRYNDCQLKPFPHFKYGLIAGYGGSKLFISSQYENSNLLHIKFNYEMSFAAGVFIDHPILVSDFSIHTELYYSRHGYSYNASLNNADIDFVANTSSLYLPILIRYTVPSNRNRLFINAGCNLSYNLTNENNLYLANTNQSNIEILDESGTMFISNENAGYAIGGGIEFKISNRRSFFIELRYTRLFGLSVREPLNNSEIYFFTGISF